MAYDMAGVIAVERARVVLRQQGSEQERDAAARAYWWPWSETW